MSDRRLTPATARVALAAWRDRLDRPAYCAGEAARVIAPLADLCASPGGARDRQLVHGADVTVIERDGGHAFVQAAQDGYCGWIAAQALGGAGATITHRVAARASHIYPQADMKHREISALPMNARLAVTAIADGFAHLAGGGFVPAQHIADSPATNPVAVAERLLGTPYLWGGNSGAGIDCSGLVQAALVACAAPCPGDSDLQMATFAPVDAPRRGDLLFWRGHVAMAVSADRMIHATAFAMAVIHEPIAAAIARIEASGGGPLTGIRRPAYPPHCTL